MMSYAICWKVIYYHARVLLVKYMCIYCEHMTSNLTGEFDDVNSNRTSIRHEKDDRIAFNYNDVYCSWNGGRNSNSKAYYMLRTKKYMASYQSNNCVIIP